MLEQFQKVLLTPKPSQQTYLKKVQDTMLNTMQNMLPQNFDFGQLAKIFQKETQYQNLASLTYKLTQYFVRIITQNFISLQSYFSLQQQTQKLQSTIRAHIKMQQQMKMYLQHLEYKIERYEYHLKRLRKKHYQNIQSSNQLKEYKEKDNIEQLKKNQTQLMKERLILLRKVDHLERKLKDQQVELRRLNSPTSATIQQIKEGLYIKQKQISQSNQISNVPELSKLINQNIDRRMSTYSLSSDHQITQKKASIPTNGSQNYRLYSLTGKDQNSINNFTSIQYIQAKRQIPSDILEHNQISNMNKYKQKYGQNKKQVQILQIQSTQNYENKTKQLKNQFLYQLIKNENKNENGKGFKSSVQKQKQFSQFDNLNHCSQNFINKQQQINQMNSPILMLSEIS